MVAIADEKQGDEKLDLIRQISGLADGITQKYVGALLRRVNSLRDFCFASTSGETCTGAGRFSSWACREMWSESFNERNPCELVSSGSWRQLYRNCRC
jgi:hypothetical protein